ncbi:MAG TPA: hypothetical protein V6C84_16215 [Coleofasciculaceae cyanobacterium]|jgi:hypothetical protein
MFDAPTEKMVVVEMVPTQGKNLIIYSGHISKALDHNHPHWINLADRYDSSGITSTVDLAEHIWLVELSKMEGVEVEDKTPYFRASYKTSTDQEREDFIVFPASSTAAELRGLQSKGINWIRLSTAYSNISLSTKKLASCPLRSLHRAIVRLFEVWRSLTLEQVFKGLCCETEAQQTEVLRLLESGEVKGVNLINGRWEVDDWPSQLNHQGIRFKPFTQGMKRLHLKPFTPEAIALVKSRARRVNQAQ